MISNQHDLDPYLHGVSYGHALLGTKVQRALCKLAGDPVVAIPPSHSNRRSLWTKHVDEFAILA